MKLEYQSRWLRLVIELLPTLSAIRRYRVAPVHLEGQAGRLLRRRIAGELRRRPSASGGTSSASPQLPLNLEGQAL